MKGEQTEIIEIADEELERIRAQSRISSQTYRDKMRQDLEWVKKEQQREKNRPKRKRNRVSVDLPNPPTMPTTNTFDIQGFAEKSMGVIGDKMGVIGDKIGDKVADYSKSIIKEVIKSPDIKRATKPTSVIKNDDEDSSSGSEEESVVAVYKAPSPPPKKISTLPSRPSSRPPKKPSTLPSRPSSCPPSPPPPPPATLSDYRCAKSSSGRVYYFNCITNQSFWEPPQVAIERRFDENKQPYYLNLITNETTFTKPLTWEGRSCNFRPNSGGAKRKRESSISTPVSSQKPSKKKKKKKVVKSILSPSSQTSSSNKAVKFSSPHSQHPVRMSKFAQPVPIWKKNPNEVDVANAQAIIYRESSYLIENRRDLAKAVDREHVLGEKVHLLVNFHNMGDPKHLEPTPMGKSKKVVDEVPVIPSSFDPELCDFLVDTFFLGEEA